MIIIKKLAYSLAILFGIFNLIFAFTLQSGNYGGSGLSQAEINQGMTSTAMVGLAGFLMLVGGVGGFLGKNWSKMLVLFGVGLAAAGMVYGGVMLYAIFLAGVGVLVYIKG